MKFMAFDPDTNSGLGMDWIWEANSEEEAMKLYIAELLDTDFTLSDYLAYCDEIDTKPVYFVDVTEWFEDPERKIV